MNGFSVGSFVSRRWRWASLAVVLGILFLARLGAWQLDRLEWRRGLNEATAAELALPPVLMNEADLMSLDWERMENRQVQAAGRFDLANQMIVESQIYNEQQGRYLVTPLLLAGQETAVLVNRGWLPITEEDFAAYNPQEIDEVFGYVQLSEAFTDGRVSELTADGRIFRIDVDVIGETLPYEILPIFISAVPPAMMAGDEIATQQALPYPVQPDLSLSEGSHLSYAYQWFIFALMLAMIYVYYVYRQEVSPPPQSR